MRVAVGLVAGALFAAALVYATLGETAVECDVCVEYGHETACRSGSGADRELAIQGAIANACAVLGRGVTRGIQCTRSAPRSVRCSE